MILIYMIFHFHHQQTGGESPPDAVKCGNLTCVNLGSEVIIVMMMIMIIQVMMMTIIMITRVMIMCTIWYDNSLEDLKSHSDSHCYCYRYCLQIIKCFCTGEKCNSESELPTGCDPKVFIAIESFLFDL